MQIRITPNNMRAELAKNAARMRGMRAGALEAGKVSQEGRIAFRREIACAMSYVEAVENTAIASPLVEKLLKCSSDPAVLSKYDSTQDSYWKPSFENDGKVFLSALRLLTLHYMHAGAQSAEDAFFMFQVLKCRFEQDPAARTADNFLQPAYGGIWLPRDKDYTGTLMRHLSNDRAVKVIDSDCRLVLRLDWWPDEGWDGVTQLERVVNAAGQMGYPRVEFIMPHEYEYKEMHSHFGTAIIARQENDRGKQKWIGSMATSITRPSAPLDAAIANAEIADTPVASLKNGALSGLQASAFAEREGLVVAAGMGSIGFTDRLLLALETERAIVNVGVYLRALGTQSAKAAVDALVKGAIEIGASSALDSGKWENAILSQVKKTGHNLCYAVLRNKNTGEEDNLESANKEPEWNDIEG